MRQKEMEQLNEGAIVIRKRDGKEFVVDYITDCTSVWLSGETRQTKAVMCRDTETNKRVTFMADEIE